MAMKDLGLGYITHWGTIKVILGLGLRFRVILGLYGDNGK